MDDSDLDTDDLSYCHEAFFNVRILFHLNDFQSNLLKAIKPAADRVKNSYI